MKVYKVDINGIEHTLQLSDEDAERLGVKVQTVESKVAPAPANKARTAANKGA